MGRCVALGADHGGFPLKSVLDPWLRAHSLQPEDDYPDYAELIADAVASGRTERGILLCGSGVGACIAANKVAGIRACLCHDAFSARQGVVEDDDMNIICLGARVVGVELAMDLNQSQGGNYIGQ